MTSGAYIRKQSPAKLSPKQKDMLSLSSDDVFHCEIVGLRYKRTPNGRWFRYSEQYKEYVLLRADCVSAELRFLYDAFQRAAGEK